LKEQVGKRQAPVFGSLSEQLHSSFRYEPPCLIEELRVPGLKLYSRSLYASLPRCHVFVVFGRS